MTTGSLSLRSPEFKTKIFTEDKKIYIVRQQDVEPILEDNKRMQLTGAGYSRDKFIKFLARIPVVVIEHWLNKGINIFDKNDEKKIMALLNDPEWKYLKTIDGRV